MNLLIHPDGTIQAVYTEQIDLPALGYLAIRRASHVEADESGHWWADLSPIAGPRLGPFLKRSQALEAESVWITQHLFHGEPS